MGSFKLDVELFFLVVLSACLLAFVMWHAMGWYQRRQANRPLRTISNRHLPASMLAASAASNLSIPPGGFALPPKKVLAEAEIELHAVVTSIKW
jgi:hypothetical protein